PYEPPLHCGRKALPREKSKVIQPPHSAPLSWAAECGVLFCLISCRIFSLSEIFAFCAVQRPLRFAICRFSLDIILNLQTARSGMTSEQGMHLYFTICPVRDEISGDESSLEEDFYPQG
ncbi:MAG: hypothetical protein SOS94_00510, partial [Lachnospiraceae bacterium]|nr:hypothetical protein [Lachnospiraceae bacterium]